MDFNRLYETHPGNAAIPSDQSLGYFRLPLRDKLERVSTSDAAATFQQEQAFAQEAAV